MRALLLSFKWDPPPPPQKKKSYLYTHRKLTDRHRGQSVIGRVEKAPPYPCEKVAISWISAHKNSPNLNSVNENLISCLFHKFSQQENHLPPF